MCVRNRKEPNKKGDLAARRKGRINSASQIKLKMSEIIQSSVSGRAKKKRKTKKNTPRKRSPHLTYLRGRPAMKTGIVTAGGVSGRSFPDSAL